MIYNLPAINSATAYPSIPTYHAIGERGRLLPEFIPLPPEVVISEKIDGTNTRLIFLPNGRYIIGSRNELLTARGDLVANPALGIVDAVRPIAERLAEVMAPGTVLYFETYGGKTTAGAKNYTASQAVDVRLFDIAHIPLDKFEAVDVRDVAAWRDAGGQDFSASRNIMEFAQKFGLSTVPYILHAGPPTDIRETAEWLRRVSDQTSCGIDAHGPSEGVVVRTPDRRLIVKLRHEDYARTLRK